jgi:hypothetical protein
MTDALFTAVVMHCLALNPSQPSKYEKCFRATRDCYLPAYGTQVETATKIVEACALKQEQEGKK